MHLNGKNVSIVVNTEVMIGYVAVVEVVTRIVKNVIMNIIALNVETVIQIWMDDVKNVGDAKAVFLICVKMDTVPIV